MSSSIERTFSVDDLVGGIWRLGQAGMARTDSEAAFQEFLKRIPSASNLAAAAAASQLDSTSAAQLQQLQQQVQQQQQQASSSTATAVLPAGALSDVNGAGLGGIPRVPSLDFLRQLASVQQQFGPGGPASTIKLENSTPPPAPLSLPGLSPADLATLNASALSTALQAVPGLTTAGHPLAAAALHNPAAAAAALQLTQLNRLTAAAAAANSAGANQSGAATSGASSGERDNDKAEVRRARRMLSNRESARRSRRRKQEHLSKLEQEINVLLDEKKIWTERVQTLERKFTSVDDENKRLREENERLRDELRFLRNELKDRNGYRRAAEHDDDDYHVSSNTAKRHKADAKSEHKESVSDEAK
mmetsp:Transcript_17271/g.37259  ORF Transcript_17271/g.37259 Transcript_17271/m.37259 type:complete len:361 (+) Transcript_17271:179-1261(+)|eukprot:CAMPEP_0202901738 /NCGR_PEP_ID=MMETSP1392-20130828/14428_1 /ASSEMBLY_ACC=CAM_ASM_000868 /TAXON_ID=225041 /ORGANISM="Chlamydomonas chlamydogama, Strain SAG 11-48b" /LENGTH=360 /DNA_ID=CAMNT_0049588347 /DNA_START=165 /DNA_END=1247 /DNA_ORIENTATION=-